MAPVRSPLRVLQRRVIVVVFGFLLLFVPYVFWWIDHPVYKAQATAMLELRTDPVSIGATAQDYRLLLTQLTTTINLMRSDTILRPVVEALHLETTLVPPPKPATLGTPPYQVSLSAQDVAMQAILRKLRKKYLDVSHVPLTNLITVSVEHKEPVLAARIANQVVHITRQWVEMRLSNEVNTVELSVADELENTRNELKSAEESLREYRKSSKDIFLTEGLAVQLERLAQLNRADVEASVAEREAAARIEALPDEIAKREAVWAEQRTAIHDPTIDKLQQQIAQAWGDYEQASVEYAPESPEVTATMARVKRMEQLLQMEVELIVRSKPQLEAMDATYGQMIRELLNATLQQRLAQVRRQAIQQVMAKINGELESLPGHQIDISRLARAVKIREGALLALEESLRKIRVAKHKEALGGLRILEEAEVPSRPSGRLSRLLAGALMAGACALGFAFLLEWVWPGERPSEAEPGL